MPTGQCRYSGLQHGQVNGYHVPYSHPYSHVRVVLIRQIINQVANKDNSGT